MKAKIKTAHSLLGAPPTEGLHARVSDVLTALFLVFNEGYPATGPDTDPMRDDLTDEAIRLARLLRALLPADGEMTGLLARIAHPGPACRQGVGRWRARHPVRAGLRAWDVALIAEGHMLVRERLAAGVAPGRHQILAAINAVQMSTRHVRDTDWSQIVVPYDRLVRVDRPRSLPSTGRSQSPNWTARRWHWPPSTD